MKKILLLLSMASIACAERRPQTRYDEIRISEEIDPSYEYVQTYTPNSDYDAPGSQTPPHSRRQLPKLKTQRRLRTRRSN